MYIYMYIYIHTYIYISYIYMYVYTIYILYHICRHTNIVATLGCHWTTAGDLPEPFNNIQPCKASGFHGISWDVHCHSHPVSIREKSSSFNSMVKRSMAISQPLCHVRSWSSPTIPRPSSRCKVDAATLSQRQWPIPTSPHRPFSPLVDRWDLGHVSQEVPLPRNVHRTSVHRHVV